MFSANSIIHKLALRTSPEYRRLNAETHTLREELQKIRDKESADLAQGKFQYGIENHWCDSNGIYIQAWIRHESAKISHLTVIAGTTVCKINSFLPHGDPTASSFQVYLPWRASDLLLFEASAGDESRRFPVDLPPGPIASAPWSHAEAAPKQTSIFGADQLGGAFQTLVREINSKNLVVCEVGSRNVSPGATTKRTTFTGASKFIGVDVHMADNVDVAGDAHYLDELLGQASVDGVFSIAVMEHLSFPWLFSAAINRTLRLGGLTFHLTHQSWPIHEEPNDFWRFSDNALRILFGPEMGFEIISAGMHNRTFLYPEERRSAYGSLPLAIAYSHVFVLARKIREIGAEAVRWPVAKEDVNNLAIQYPLRVEHN